VDADIAIMCRLNCAGVTFFMGGAITLPAIIGSFFIPIAAFIFLIQRVEQEYYRKNVKVHIICSTVPSKLINQIIDHFT
jgi:hypothetical protein